MITVNICSFDQSCLSVCLFQTLMPTTSSKLSLVVLVVLALKVIHVRQQLFTFYSIIHYSHSMHEGWCTVS